MLAFATQKEINTKKGGYKMTKKKNRFAALALAAAMTLTGAPMQGTAAKEPTDTDGDGIPNWDSEKDLSVTGNYVRAKIRGEEAPLIGTSELIADFEDGETLAIVPSDSPEEYSIEVVTLEDGNNALKLSAREGGIWDDKATGYKGRLGKGRWCLVLLQE